MATSRILSRFIVPKTLNRLSLVGNKNGSVRNFFHHHRKYLPEEYFGSASNVFQRWEKEFDRMQQQFGNFFQDLKNNRILTNYSPGLIENNLITTEPDGTRKFHLTLNISNFKPEEIKIKTQNGTLIISAKKENKANNIYSLNEFSQTYTLPEELNIENLKSTYTENGILSIEAPLPKLEQQPKERQIPIERTK